MKKTVVLLLMFALVTGVVCADNPYLSDWVTTYNAHASAHGLDTLDAALFEYDDEEGIYAATLDDNTALVLGLNGENIYICGLQALESDERSVSIMTCALAAASGDIDYDKAFGLFTKLFAKLEKSGDRAYDMQGSWYLMASIETDEDGTFLAAAFYSMDAFLNLNGPNSPDDTLPGNIWDGLEPDADEPASKATPKPQEGHYRI